MFTSSVLFVGLVDSSAFCAVQSCNARPTNRADHSVGVLRMSNSDPWNRLAVAPGDRYGRFTIVEETVRIYQSGTTRRQFICKCDCGIIRTVLLNNLRSGTTKSCGCLRRGGYPTHGYARRQGKGPTYNTWMRMRNRCRNPHCKDYEYYGGRGISVCERWNSFEAFLEDMGERPSASHSIDRIDHNGNYEPKNCRWATVKEQRRNMRSNILLEYNGETLCISEWADRIGMARGTLSARILRLGWNAEKALTTPPHRAELKGGAT